MMSNSSEHKNKSRLKRFSIWFLVLQITLLSFIIEGPLNVQASDNEVWTYNYTGAIQSLSITQSGKYKVEVYGAQGASNGGKGGKAEAVFDFYEDEKLTINVGGQNGYNGGGNGSAKGGGASDVRLNGTNLNNRLLTGSGGGGGSGGTDGGEGTGAGGASVGAGAGSQGVNGGGGGRSHNYSYSTGYWQDTGYWQETGYYETVWVCPSDAPGWLPNCTRQVWVSTGRVWVNTGQVWVSTGTYTTQGRAGQGGSNYFHAVAQDKISTNGVQLGNGKVVITFIEIHDNEPPVIELTPNPTSPTNKDVTVKVVITDEKSEVVEKKWASGNREFDYFSSSGTNLDSSFIVSQNGMYTVYAKDELGNEAISRVEINNIDKVKPTINLSASPTTPTNGDVAIHANIADEHSGVSVKKWAKGNQSISYFTNNGNEFFDTSFEVSENGTYTVYARDVAGNELIKTISVNNIDKEVPNTPMFSASPTNQTEGDVTVTINYDSNGIKEHYRIITQSGTGDWKDYAGPVVMDENGILEARVQGKGGNWSKIGRYVVDNIITEADNDNSNGQDGDGNNNGQDEVEFGDYEIPLQQSSMKDLGVTGNKRHFEWEYETDLFFMTKHTGFLKGYSYTEDVKKNFMDGTTLPSYASLMQQGKTLTETDFESQVGEDYVDKVLYTESEDDFDKLKRYMIPVEADSPLRPGETYKNHIAVENMGLSDLTLGYDQSFSFDRYLFGTGHDEAWIIEQVDSRTQLDDMDASKIHTVEIKYDEVEELTESKKSRTKERMHDFRISDRNFFGKIKEFLNLN